MDQLSNADETPSRVVEVRDDFSVPVQFCPVCKAAMSALPGTRDAACKNCGYKDPCCE